MKVLIAELERIACDAGRLISEVRSKGIEVMAKGDGSPVTEADGRAEALIVERLGQAWPDIPIIAEERVSREGNPEGIGERFFLVDPLDGTKEFIKGRLDFTVNIALIDGGQPVAGVVMAPGRHEIYSGGEGCAHMAKVPDVGPPVERRDIHVRVPGETWTALVSVSHMTEATRQFLQRLPIAEQFSLGSSLKFCLLAAGQADLYPRLGRTMQWDTAAGDAVLRAAGGLMVTRTGEALRYGPRNAPPQDRFENCEFIAFAGPLDRLRGLIAA